ncbi:MAG: helix-turn-helix domain-containing protein [Rickettsiaceae bacterium]|nr:helix-turn-helix domain-containing protein [Rickettsiaceae bacterium]
MSTIETTEKINEISSLLKKTRLERGIDLEKISEDLRIRKKYLEAIENGDLKQVPGKAYRDGYIRMYSSYLGLFDEVAKLLVDEPKKNKQKFVSTRKQIDDNMILGSIFGVLIFVLFILIWFRSDSGYVHDKTVLDHIIEAEKMELLE